MEIEIEKSHGTFTFLKFREKFKFDSFFFFNFPLIKNSTVRNKFNLYIYEFPNSVISFLEWKLYNNSSNVVMIIIDSKKVSATRDVTCC